MTKVAYCIGAQKAGTSWLHHVMSVHGMVQFPLAKEPHYWDHVARGTKERNDAAYLARLSAGSSTCTTVGDFTPAYSTLGLQLIHCIDELIPELKVIYLLRDPYARAWSAIKMYARNAHLLEDEIDEGFCRSIVNSTGFQARADFKTTIERWSSVVGDRLLVLDSSMLGTRPHVLVRLVADHLGVDCPALDDNVLHSRVNSAGKGGREVPEWFAEISTPQLLSASSVYAELVQSGGTMVGVK